MVELDIIPYAGWSPAEVDRRQRAANKAEYQKAEEGRRVAGDRKRQRFLRQGELDHQRRVGKRGSAARAGMVRPTAEFERRHEVEVLTHALVDDRGQVTRTVAPKVMTQTPLDRYFRRSQIDERQHRAGEKLRTDWYTAGLEPHVVANLTGSGGGSECAYGMARHEGQAMAREGFRQAVKAVGIRMSPILIAVCCEDRSAADWLLSKGFRVAAEEEVRDEEKQRKSADWRIYTEAMVTLRLALDVLADHYRY